MKQMYCPRLADGGIAFFDGFAIASPSFEPPVSACRDHVAYTITHQVETIFGRLREMLSATNLADTPPRMVTMKIVDFAQNYETALAALHDCLGGVALPAIECFGVTALPASATVAISFVFQVANPRWGLRTTWSLGLPQ